MNGSSLPREPIVYDPAKPHPSIVFHPRDPQKTVPYWKLAESDRVAADQILCMLDDQMITIKRDAAQKTREASSEVLRTRRRRGHVREKITIRESGGDPAIPADRRPHHSDRFLENLAQANLAIAKAEQEVKEADQPDRQAPHPQPGRWDHPQRRQAPGEYVRPGEKIFEIQSTEKVRLEGMLDRENAACVAGT